MKVLLHIEDKYEGLFREFLSGKDFIQVLREVRSAPKSQAIQDLVDAFDDVSLHRQGKKQLKTAQDLLDEL